MRPERTTGFALSAAVALALGLGGSARAADLCVVVDPLVQLGCTESQRAPAGGEPKASSEPAGAPDLEPEPTRRSSLQPRYDPDGIAVTFEPGTSSRVAHAAIARAGATVEQAVPRINAYLAKVPPEHRAAALASLRSEPAVASAAPDLLAEAFDTRPDDANWAQQEGLRVAGFPKAWDVTRGTSRLVVAVIDSGVNPHHPDLRGALVPGYDFVNGDADAADDHGHGTSVAGVVAARANREGGVGICWQCSVMPLKVLDASGSGNDTVIAAAIVWAADHGAHVINLSLGGPGSSQELSNAIAYANRRGLVVVAAAGNAGTTTQFHPAADPKAISVAATTVVDRRYSWSNFGSWVRLAAPGCNVAPLLNGGYGNFCGTSSAAPVVAGLVALELSAHPSATVREVEQALASGALPLPEVVQFGRIDAGKTLSLLKPAAEKRVSAVFRGTGPQTYELEVGSGALTARLRFSGSERLALTLTPGNVRAAGRSPVRLTAATTAGRIMLRVSGSKKARFVLDVNYTSS
jgi:subtilisin family serine protease